MSRSDTFRRRLNIEVQRDGDEVRIVLNGEVDIGSAADLEEVLLAAEASKPREIYLDLRQLEFLDSTGLRVIISSELRTSVDGQRLVLIPGPERVQRLFAMTGTAEFLHFADEEHPPDNVTDLRGRNED